MKNLLLVVFAVMVSVLPSCTPFPMGYQGGYDYYASPVGWPWSNYYGYGGYYRYGEVYHHYRPPYIHNMGRGCRTHY